MENLPHWVQWPIVALGAIPLLRRYVVFRIALALALVVGGLSLLALAGAGDVALAGILVMAIGAAWLFEEIRDKDYLRRHAPQAPPPLDTPIREGGSSEDHRLDTWVEDHRLHTWVDFERKGWLELYLEAAIARKLCIKMCCTTCGSESFHDGLVRFASERMPGHAFPIRRDPRLPDTRLLGGFFSQRAGMDRSRDLALDRAGTGTD